MSSNESSKPESAAPLPSNDIAAHQRFSCLAGVRGGRVQRTEQVEPPEPARQSHHHAGRRGAQTGGPRVPDGEQQPHPHTRRRADPGRTQVPQPDRWAPLTPT
ncbi:hypothetical protein CDAR_487221 [Caerostris darwini]|uniref:Uncharacterized protein n=1 Tax=Caerostris darwini TaxID=1538125 RepID=A0AAV4UEX9_9ARAC|nr:hypothetical protein CDAR_487221 [Caerostris darwini]